MTQKLMGRKYYDYELNTRPLFQYIAQRLEIFLLAHGDALSKARPFSAEDTGIYMEESDGLYVDRTGGAKYGVENHENPGLFAFMLHVPFTGSPPPASNPRPEMLVMYFTVDEGTYSLNLMTPKWAYCVSHFQNGEATEFNPYTGGPRNRHLNVPHELLLKFVERAKELTPLPFEENDEATTAAEEEVIRPTQACAAAQVDTIPIEQLYPKLALIQNSDGSKSVSVEVWQSGDDIGPVEKIELVTASEAAYLRRTTQYVIKVSDPSIGLRVYWTGNADHPWAVDPREARGYNTEEEASEVLLLLKKTMSVIGPYDEGLELPQDLQYDLTLYIPRLEEIPPQ